MRVQSRLPLLILVLALAIVFYRLLLGDVLFWGLPSLQFYPWREYAFDLVRAGQLPLWNPYNGAGAPLFANYQSSLLYPLSWLGFVLPLAQTMSIVAVLHLFIGGWGMWRFTGELGYSPVGRGASTLAFGMTAFLMARVGTLPMVQAAAWLPWLLWAALRLLQTGRPRSAGLLAIFTGLLLLAGHAQTAWYSLLLVGLFALWWAVFPGRQQWRQTLVRLATIAGCVALGAGVAALQLAGTVELLQQSQRSGGVDYDFAMNYSYAPARILNLFAPNAFGTPANASYITGGAFFEDAVYIGVIPLFGAFAAVIGGIVRWRRKVRLPVDTTMPFWVIVVVVGFVLALGINTGIFPFLYEHVPTFNLFQGPVRWHLWTVFGLSALAGMGVTAWGRSRSLRRWAARALVAFGAASALALAALILFQSDVRAVTLLEEAGFVFGVLGVVACALTLAQPEPGTGGHATWSLIVLLVVAADLTWAAWGLNPTVTPSFFNPLPDAATEERRYWTADTEQAAKFDQYFRFDNYLVATDNWQAVRATDLPNMNLIDRVMLLNNFEPLLVGHFADYVDLIEATGNSALLRGAGVGAMYAPELQPIDSSAVRAWLVSSVCWHADEFALKAALSDPDWQPDQQVHMLGVGDCAAPEAPSGEVLALADASNSLTIQVEAVRGSWLVLADTDYPGWHAFVDGVETPIYRANLAFRALQVDAGQHVVQFEYRPDWLLPGALVSAVSLLIALLLYRLGA